MPDRRGSEPARCPRGNPCCDGSDLLHGDWCEQHMQEGVVAALEALRDIATREWRDEGGRIARAVALDGLSKLDGLGE